MIRAERPSLGAILFRAFRRRCPRCGNGRMFAGLIRMHERCDACGLKYERAPGYFLGSTYINYGATALTITIAYLLLHFGAGFSNRQLTAPLLAVCVIVPLFFFRFARALWLGMDFYFDLSGFEEDESV